MERIVFGGVATNNSALKVYHSEVAELISVIKSLLVNVDLSNNQKRSFGAHPRAQGNTIQYMVQNNAVYFSAATPNFSHSHCFKFLDSVARETANVDLNSSKGIQQLEQWLKTEMKRYTEENSMDQIKSISKQVDSVKDLMISNIEQALNRGESLERIKIKSEDLEEKAVTFKKKTKTLKCTMIRENIKMTIILIAIFICIILFLAGLGVSLYFIIAYA